MKNFDEHKWFKAGALALILVAMSIAAAGCGASSVHETTKQEEITFRDRDPSHMHGIPSSFKGGHGGPPPSAAKSGK